MGNQMTDRTRAVIWTPSPTSEQRWSHGGPRVPRGWCLAALLAVALGSSASGVALAAPRSGGDAKAAAHKKLVEGAELLKRGDYQTALARFQAAYDLVRSPKIQYNFGLAYIGLGRNAEAFQAFLAFLGEASDASAETITKARAYKEGLVQKICRLTVHADVDGASIGVDARSYGVTPRPEEILLDPGSHTLLVEKAGIDRRYSKTFDAVAGHSLTLEAALLAIEPDPRVVREPSPPRNTELMVASAPPARPSPRPGSRPARITGLVVGGLAVATLGFGTVEWVIKEQKYRSFNDQRCDVALDQLGGGNCPALKKDGDRAKGLGYGGFAVAGGLAVVSAVFLVVGRGGFSKSGTTETALACAPSLTTPGGACSWRF